MKSTCTTSMYLLICFFFSMNLSATEETLLNISLECDTLKLEDPTVTGSYCGECLGTISLYLAQGNGCNVEYSIDAGVTWQISNVFEGLCVNDYLLLVKKIDDPTVYDVTATQIPSTRDPSIDLISMSCKEDSYAAELNVEMHYGTAGFSVSYTDPTGTSNSIDVDDYDFSFDIPEPEIGYYHFTIEDKYGCSKDTTIYFDDDCVYTIPIIISTPEVTGAYCGECNGSYTINVVQGNIPEIEYSNDGGNTWQNSNVFNNLCPGNYLVMVRNRFYPENQVVATFQIPSRPDLKLVDIQTCNSNQNTAEVSVEISGGKPEYYLRYTNPIGQTIDVGYGVERIDFDIENFIEGDYHFFVQDKLGCTRDTMLFIQECQFTEQIIIVDATVIGAYCDACNGSITVNLSQGLSPDIEYSIDAGVSWQDTNYFDNLCNGDFLILTRHKLDPLNEATNTAQIPIAPDLKMLDFSYSCYKHENSADAVMKITGGSADYTLTYINPLGEENSINSSSDFEFKIEDLIQGDYQFIVEDRLACVKDTIITIVDDCSDFAPGNQIPIPWNESSFQGGPGVLSMFLTKKEKEEQIDLKIYSSFGQLVFSSSILSNESHEVLAFPTGTYLIVLESTNGKRKVFKQVVY